MAEVLLSKKIDDIFLNIKTYQAEVIISEEEKINKFLDSILTVQNSIKSYSDKLCNLVDDFEDLTSYEISGDMQTKDEIDSLLKMAESLHKDVIHSYIHYKGHPTVSKVANTQIKEFKCVIDDFKDVIQDLRLIFFDTEYMERMKELTERNRL